MNELKQCVVDFYNELERIGQVHDEFYDTDVRECLYLALNYYFVWGNDIKEMPLNYSMFSAQADEKVAATVRQFVEKANIVAGERGVKIGQERLNYLEDGDIETEEGQQYDCFIGFAEEILPPEKPHQMYFEPGDYDYYEK